MEALIRDKRRSIIEVESVVVMKTHACRAGSASGVDNYVGANGPEGRLRNYGLYHSENMFFKTNPTG